MSSTCVDVGNGPPPPSASNLEKGPVDDAIRPSSESKKDGNDPSIDRVSIAPGDQTHRRLKSRHIQLIGIGGTIGTAIFVQMGRGLVDGGPGSLFLAFTIWCTFILAITVCMAEMVTYLPISSPFIRFAGRYVDESLGFAAGWNFFIFEAALVPFEVTACNVIIHYWSDAVPAGGIIAIILVLYGLINLLAVKWYGEAEFWTALGKVLLIVALILFTFIVMLGGNPLGSRFGFTYWESPGAFATYYRDGSLGRFVDPLLPQAFIYSRRAPGAPLGFLQCLIQASFTIAGPDYVSMAAGEAENPRVVLPRAFNAVFYRLTSFFVLGSLAVGVLVPHDSAELSLAFSSGAPGAAASPYVLAMNRLRIRVLPDVVNAMVLTAAFSAGNSYVYCASRSLYGLALEGKAPRVFARCSRQGVPYAAVLLVLAIALLSFLQLSNDAARVLQWFVSLVTASQLINFSVICFTYLRWHKALAAQGVDRRGLPYRARWQPFAAWYGLVGTALMTLVGGYTVFLPGRWDVPAFLFSYTMIFVCPVLFVAWKVIKRTKFHRPEDVDLVTHVEEIEEYQRTFVAVPASNWFVRFLDWAFG
ncbi:general amino acid permease [Podospora conica]|nr:general amino acid permease [Schizothecium conicum]